MAAALSFDFDLSLIFSGCSHMQLEILWLQTGNMLSFPLSLRISSHTFPLQWIKETGRAEFSSFKVGVVRPSICVLRKAAQQREPRWPQLSPVLGPLSPTAQSRPLHQLQGFSPHLTSQSAHSPAQPLCYNGLSSSL